MFKCVDYIYICTMYRYACGSIFVFFSHASLPYILPLAVLDCYRTSTAMIVGCGMHSSKW